MAGDMLRYIDLTRFDILKGGFRVRETRDTTHTYDRDREGALCEWSTTVRVGCLACLVRLCTLFYLSLSW